MYGLPVSERRKDGGSMKSFSIRRWEPGKPSDGRPSKASGEGKSLKPCESGAYEYIRWHYKRTKLLLGMAVMKGKGKRMLGARRRVRRSRLREGGLDSEAGWVDECLSWQSYPLSG